MLFKTKRGEDKVDGTSWLPKDIQAAAGISTIEQMEASRGLYSGNEGLSRGSPPCLLCVMR